MKSLIALFTALFITGLLCMAMVRYPIGQPVPHEVYTAVMDPCDSIYSFLEPVDPNWIRDFGDNERTRHIQQTSKNRIMILRDQKIISEIARRLLVLEEFNKTYLDFSGWDPNEGVAIRLSSFSGSGLPLSSFMPVVETGKFIIDPNDPNEAKE